MEEELKQMYGRIVIVYHKTWETENGFTLTGLEGVLEKDTEHFVHLRNVNIKGSIDTTGYAENRLDNKYAVVGKDSIIQIQLCRH